MRPATAAVFVGLLVVLGGLGVVAFTGSDDGGTLAERWVSDTARNNTINHHAVGANGSVVVAPVTATSGDASSRRGCALARLAADDGAVDWRTGVPPSQCFVHALTEPAVADLDRDGGMEVVAGSTENAVLVLDAETGREQFRVPTPVYGYARPTVADLDGDGRPEITASDINGSVVVASADGSVRWRANVSGTVWDAPVVADVDGDDRREVVVGSGDEVVAFAADGAVDWRSGTDADGVAVVADGGETTVVAAGDDGVAALDGETGSVDWRRNVSGPRLHAGGDGDGDGRSEVYVSLSGNVVAALDADDGDEEWRTRLAPEGQASTRAPALGDLTGDGGPELVAAGTDGTVAVLDPRTGAELAAYEREVPVWTPPTLADVTSDPGREILVHYGDGRVVALSYAE